MTRIFVLLFLLLPALAMAEVNSQTGYFKQSFDDVSLKNKAGTLKFTRTYRSASMRTGWFGPGWSSSLEKRLVVAPDDTVHIHENDAVTTLQLNAACGTSQVLRLEHRYKRVRCASHPERETVEYFDLQGRLASLEYRGGYRIELDYLESPQEILVRDNRRQWLRLAFGDTGRVVSVKTHQGATLSYSYDTSGQLIEVTGAAESPRRYAYGQDHLLTRIDYSEDQGYAIAYFPETRQVQEVIDPFRLVTQYEYGIDAAEPTLHWTRKTSLWRSGRKESLHYQFRYRDVASPHRPLSQVIVQAAAETLEISYDAAGRIVRETSSSGEFNAFDYHPVHRKITKVSNQEGTTMYSYDRKGNLRTALGQDGNRIAFSYYADETIRSIVETNAGKTRRRQILVRYNALKKPTVITLVGVGTLRVRYGAHGDIDKVSSRGGAELSRKITETFQSMMAVLNMGKTRLSANYFCCCSD